MIDAWVRNEWRNAHDPQRSVVGHRRKHGR
jgi:hypothetical protein